MYLRLLSVAFCLCLFDGPVQLYSAETSRLQLKDVFDLEYASDPRISPDGKRVVYVRNSMDIMKDRRRGKLWVVDVDGSNHRPVTSGTDNESSPRWSPTGDRLLYVVSEKENARLVCRWMDGGQTATIVERLVDAGGFTWSPDGKSVAFVQHVEEKPEPYVKLPEKPKGAEWADAPKVIADVRYRYDGKGYRKSGHQHLFVVPAEGGTPRQLTTGKFDVVGSPSWFPDGTSLVFTSNRRKGADHDPLETELYRVSLDGKDIVALTDRKGPDDSPAVSPDGKRIAYVGFDDKEQSYQLRRVYVMDADGKNSKVVAPEHETSMGDPRWSGDGKGIYFQSDRRGVTSIHHATLAGSVTTRGELVGGTTIGRPYSSGSYTVSRNGTVAYTYSRPTLPAEVVVRAGPEDAPKRLTRLNADLFAGKELGRVESIEYRSSHTDKRKIQGWIVKPPQFDAKKKYPLILEIHGGPFANYGPRFSVEMQLYAAAGYVVFYANPRGSTSYGEEFANLIHHAYPGHDYDDLMAGVDAMLDTGYIDEKNLFVTGGSGGGVLSSWIVGKTNRFKAAVVAKPVINWYSFVLNADAYPFFAKYWFPGPPWEHEDHYSKRSPISLVGNVQTPTMLLTGEKDYRTPISESEQFYQALKLRKVETMLVRIPGASHNIAARPSQLIAKVACVLKWFETHKAR